MMAAGVGLGLLAALGLFTACGPSIRRTYQSDMAFEHCFDLDYDPQSADADKSACWRVWLDDQIYNQPDDKIRYAELRRMEIAKGISIPGPPGMPGQFFKRPRLLVDTASMPPSDAGVDSGEDMSESAGVDAGPGAR